jgi:UDP-N-acetylmuramyl pentapeptide synthase
VNGDDRLVTQAAKGMRDSWSYGFTRAGVKVRGKILGMDQRGCARFAFVRRGAKRATEVRLNVPGEHHALNGLAATAAGLAFGIPASEIREALEGFRPVYERMQVVTSSGITILNDTYNANPDSTVAALRTLAAMTARGKKIAVLADMLELGKHSEAQHALVGREAERLGVDFLLTFGIQAKQIHDAAQIGTKFHYDNKNLLAEYLFELLSPGDIVLVKGSRGMKMEDVVVFLQDRLASKKDRFQKSGIS